MRRFSAGFRLSLLVFFVVALCATTTGCGLFSKPDKAFIAGVDAGLNGSGLLDEYVKYVENDPNLKLPETKQIKKDTVAGLRKLIVDIKAR